MRKLLLTLIVSLLATQASALTQEGTFKINEVGYAEVAIKQTLNAQQWQQWMGVYGNSQHVLKRDLESEFSVYHVDAFDISRRDSDREFELSFSAHGAAVYRGNDRWEVDLEEGVRARKLNETQWLVQMTQNEGGELIQQDFTFELPAGVSSSEKGFSELGDEVIRYVLPASGSGIGGINFLAVAMTVLGLVLLFFGFTRKEPQLATVTSKPVREIAEEKNSVSSSATDGEIIEHEK